MESEASDNSRNPSSDEEDVREDVKSDGLPVLSFSSLKNQEYLSTQLITHGV